MKKLQISDVHQRIRLLKHIRLSKSQLKRINKLKIKKINSSQAKHKLIKYDHSPILNLIQLPKRSGNERGKVKLKTPRDFCLHTNPRPTLSWLAKFQATALTESVNEIIIDHCRTTRFSLAAESLLGIICNEIKEIRRNLDNPIRIIGVVHKNHEYNQLLEQVGIVSEVEDAKINIVGRGHHNDVNKIHVFKQSSNLNESISNTAEGIIKVTAEKLIEHINAGLHDHALKLTAKASSNIRKSIGEVLDNVGEHCGLSAPHWFVRGYVNNNHEHKTLELMIMNAGRPIPDTFTDLSDDHYSKKLAMEYVNMHKDKVDEGTLFTIAALQGNMSSKNEDADDTRGQGTIHLIEAFEAISQNYLSLRGNKKHLQTAKMGLISGKTIINFNNKFKCHIIEDKVTGAERVIVPFNKQNSLNIAPDKDIITRIPNTNFSGLLINIQIPLDDSATSTKRA